MPGPHDFTFVSGLAFLPHCFGRTILQLFPSTLVSLSSLPPIHSGRSGGMIVHLFPKQVYLCGVLILCLKGCMPGSDDFGSVSGGVSSAYSGYTWPDVFTLVSTCLFAYSLLRRSWPHDFTLVSGYPGYTWPEVFPTSLLVRYSWPWPDALVSLLVSLLRYSRPGDFTPVSHLSPCWSFCLSPCLSHLTSSRWVESF